MISKNFYNCTEKKSLLIRLKYERRSSTKVTIERQGKEIRGLEARARKQRNVTGRAPPIRGHIGDH